MKNAELSDNVLNTVDKKKDCKNCKHYVENLFNLFNGKIINRLDIEIVIARKNHQNIADCKTQKLLSGR